MGTLRQHELPHKIRRTNRVGVSVQPATKKNFQYWVVTVSVGGRNSSSYYFASRYTSEPTEIRTLLQWAMERRDFFELLHRLDNL